MLQSGQSLFEVFPEEVETMFDQIENAISARKSRNILSDPLCPILPLGEEREETKDVSCSFVML